MLYEVITPLRALLADPELAIDGFIGPGHVSLVTGTAPFQFISREYHRPVVVSGFEPLDLLQSVWQLLGQFETGRAEVEIQYRRVASEQGNLRAREAVAEVFEPAPGCEWRGLGWLPDSGLQLRPAYVHLDARRLLPVV